MRCIYAIKHQSSGRVYVGQTKNLKNRWATHRSYLRNNDHSNKYLQNTWNKYGEDDFSLVVLEISDKKELYELEQFWINKLDAQNPQKGFNMNPAVAGEGRKRVFSKEHREKISKSKKGVPRSKETIEKMRQGRSSYRWSDEQREKMKGRFIGEGNPFSKLTWNDVREIRMLLELGEMSKSKIAGRFNVDPSLIYQISVNKSWKIENDPLKKDLHENN